MTPSLRRPNRSSLFFVTGLLLAGGLAVGLDAGWSMAVGTLSHRIDLAQTADVPLHLPAALTATDLLAAQTAWHYFENNTDPQTGLVGSVQGFSSATLWDQGSYVMALVAARRLGVLAEPEFNQRVTRFLDSVARLPLYDNQLPNKVYDTQTMAMTDYENVPVPLGIGWSATDIGRVLLSLRILERNSPEQGARIQAAVRRWDICAITKAGEMTGAERIDGETVQFQEGRIGYEQYAARSAALWGCDSMTAAGAERIVAWESVSGVQVPVDRRTHASFGAITPTLGEPYMLIGLELGFNRETEILSARVYAANEARYQREGILTAVSEDHIDREPHFVYASVYGNARPWAVTDDKGNLYPDLRTVSLKAVMAWDALYATPYTAKLRLMMADLADAEQGWQAGKYETGLTPNTALSLNTNAVVLEAMHFKAFGPLLAYR